MECSLCGSSDVFPKNNAFVPLCRVCRTPQMRKEAHRYYRQINRAKVVNLPATLTFKEWIGILNYFGWKCAYCKVKNFSLMEHVVSLAKGGGTTAENIVPACPKCNKHKDMQYSEIYGNLMPDETIEQVKIELMQALNATAERQGSYGK